MFDCVGDSIAVGISRYLQCEHIYARTGITTQGWFQRYKMPNNKVLVVSLGSNDSFFNKKLCRFNKYKVIWIRPAKHKSYMCPKQGDVVVTFQPGIDGVHPQNYSTLARRIKYEVRTNVRSPPRVGATTL